MSDEGDQGQRKQDDHLQTPIQKTGVGAGEGSSYTKNLAEQEKRVARQTRMVLERFIWENVSVNECDNLGPMQRNQVHDAVCPDVQQEKQSSEHNEDFIDGVVLMMRKIGDEVAQNPEFNQIIAKFPILSPREMFMKVCNQTFSDGQFNWGRVVLLFYFAYRLIVKAITLAVDSIPWIRQIFSWAIEYFLEFNMLQWIMQRGGWEMIGEYWGTSSKTMTALGFTAICAVIYVWWKQQ